MSQVQLFSSGLELASLVVSTDLLQVSRDANLDLLKEINQNEPPSSPASVKFKVTPRANCTIIAFGTWPACTRDHLQGGGGGELVSSSTSPVFRFLCGSINKAALDLFDSVQTELSEIKNQLFDNSNPKQIIFNKSKPLLITGHSLGGSVASLFTLWLLEKIDLAKAKRPLCITFGSPLIGDDGLREAILKYSTWNSCFLHVVSDQDPIPRVLISPHNPPAATEYKPFGTFLLCSGLSCACFEDSESILELLMGTNTEEAENQNPNQGSQFSVYEKTVKQLNGDQVICKDTTKLVEGITLPLPAGIYTQLVAIGRLRTQQQQRQNVNTINDLIKRLEKQERKLVMGKTQNFDPSKKLNDMKIYMTYMEWYKKESKKNNIGYYDSFKRMATKTDQAVEEFRKKLTIYWKNVINEAKSKPQREGSAFRIRWLFAGTNYRRMIEPLDIAEYYCDKGGKDYITEGRSEHYKQLEKWLNEQKKPAPSINSKKQNVKSILTEDSCFWAHVEEALVSCKLLNSGDSSPKEKDSSKANLIHFEAYVLGLIDNYAVSPEIFLPESSFVQWWKEYKEIIRKEIMGTSYTSSFTDMMNTGKYKQYESGDL